MKIVNEPPRDGSQFIVNWFDDGGAKSLIIKYHNEDDMFYYWLHTYKVWMHLSSTKESTYFNDKIIIVESE